MADITIGNICPARLKYEFGKGSLAYCVHEPVIYGEEDAFLLPVNPKHIADGFTLKVCKYCGSIYAEVVK